MAKFSIDEPELEQKLRHITRIIIDNGGYVHEELEIQGCKGQLDFHMSFDIDPNTPIVALPRELMLPLDEFELGLAGDTLQILSFKPDTPPIRKELAQLMIDLFNRCNKIGWHKRVTPWIYHYDKHELYNFLVGGREPADGFPFFHKIDPENRDKLLIHTFLMTRWLKVDHGPGMKSKVVLLPLVDCVNHHPKSRPFDKYMDYENNESLILYKSSCKEGSNECFASYGFMDAHSILLHYNYIETDTFFVQSVPFEMELEDIGRLEVSNTGGSASKDELPDDLKNLSAFFPALSNDPHGHHIKVSHLLIPQQNAPRALRRIIGAILQKTTPGISERKTRKLVALVEKRAVVSTLDRYQAMKAYLQSYQPDKGEDTVVNMARQVAEIQINKVLFYKDNIMSS